MMIIIVVVSLKKKIYKNDKLHFVTGDGFFQIVTMQPAAAVCSFLGLFSHCPGVFDMDPPHSLSSKSGLNRLLFF